MATASYVESLLGGLERELRSAIKQIFTYVLNNLRFGPVAHQTRAENLQMYALTSTTPATANEEFSIRHGLSRVPYLAMPVLPLDGVNSRLVDLKVTRAADVNRVYFSSPSTSAVIWVWVE